MLLSSASCTLQYYGYLSTYSNNINFPKYGTREEMAFKPTHVSRKAVFRYIFCVLNCHVFGADDYINVYQIYIICHILNSGMIFLCFLPEFRFLKLTKVILVESQIRFKNLDDFYGGRG